MAIWEKLFSKITFKDYPDTSTPLNADNLNKMTDAIDGIDNRVVELNSNLTFKGTYTGDIDELVETDYCGGYWVQVSNASGTQPFSSGYYTLLVPIERSGRVQIAIQYATGEIKARSYNSSTGAWVAWTNTKANAPTRITTNTEIAPSSSATFNYDATKTWTTCEIMFFAYGGFRQSVKIPVTGTIVKFMTSTTEWGGSFGTAFKNGVLTITNNSDTQKVVITHIYMIP